MTLARKILKQMETSKDQNHTKEAKKKNGTWLAGLATVILTFLYFFGLPLFVYLLLGGGEIKSFCACFFITHITLYILKLIVRGWIL